MSGGQHRGESETHRPRPHPAQIRTERPAALESAQKGTAEVTDWQLWFLGCLGRAIAGAEETLSSVLAKVRFRQRFATEALNERQVKVVNRMLDGLEGRLTSSKWAKLAGCSQDTAYRDILDLIGRGVLKKSPGGGRSTGYELADP